jgi:NTP pyrophosphatase (non-canonical NTP hydrolase)
VKDPWPPRPAEYKPESTIERLAYLAEECGEVVQAVGKCLRWGLFSAFSGEANIDMLKRELQDLKVAIQLIEEAL